MKSPLCVRQYWPYRDELATKNGLVFRGARIVIPYLMRNEMTASPQIATWIQDTISTMRAIMYWLRSRMTADLTEAAQRCKTCQQSQPALPREPLVTYPIPSLPWQIVSSDCFEYYGQHCLILVDLSSDLIEIKKTRNLNRR